MRKKQRLIYFKKAVCLLTAVTFIFSNYANTTKEICAEIVQLYDSPQTEEIIKT